MLIKELFTWYPNDYHSRTSFFHLHIVSCTCICLNDTITKSRSRTRHSAMSSFRFLIQMKFSFWYEISFWYYVNWKQTSFCFFLRIRKIYFKKSQRVFKSWRFGASGAYLRWPELICMRVQVICFWSRFSAGMI